MRNDKQCLECFANAALGVKKKVTSMGDILSLWLAWSGEADHPSGASVYCDRIGRFGEEDLLAVNPRMVKDVLVVVPCVTMVAHEKSCVEL